MPLIAINTVDCPNADFTGSVYDSQHTGPRRFVNRRTLEDIFQIVVVVGVESANGQEPFGALELALDKTVFPAAVGLQSQTAIGPELPLGAKAMRRLDQSDQQSRPDRTNRWNLTQPLHRGVLAALGQEIKPHPLAQNSQGIELLVVEFGATAHAGFGDFAEPFRSVAWCVHLLAGTGNGPASIKSFQTIHYPREISSDRQIAARQFPQSS